MENEARRLPVDVFEAVVMAFAETLVHVVSEWGTAFRSAPTPSAYTTASDTLCFSESPWPKLRSRAACWCASSTIYAQVGQDRLLFDGLAGLLRIRTQWVDEWLQGSPTQDAPPTAKR